MAEKHNFIQIEGLLTRYATQLMEKKKTMQAIELYRKANRNHEAAKLLVQFGEDLKKRNVLFLAQELRLISFSRKRSMCSQP